MNKIDACFAFFSRGKLRIASTIVLNFAASILLIVLSSIQASPIFPKDKYSKADWEQHKEACKHVIIDFISPFHIEGDYGNGCPWRDRNSILRLVFASIMLLSSALAFIALYPCNKFQGKKWMWPTVYWLHWLLFVMLFVVFVLDADGLHSGFTVCVNDFKIQNGENESKIWSKRDGYKCSMAPFIYTVLVDLLCALTAYTVHKVAGLYVARSKDEGKWRENATERPTGISLASPPAEKKSNLSIANQAKYSVADGNQSPEPKRIMDHSPSPNPFDEPEKGDNPFDEIR